MPIQVEAVKPVALAVNAVPLTAPLNRAVVQALFSDLSRFELESFSPTPDGGAIIANQRLRKQLVIGATSRQISLPIPTWPQAIDEALQILELVSARLPVQAYIAAQVTCTSNYPVSPETATELLSKTLFYNPAFQALGPQLTGIGVKTFINGPLGALLVEPLLADKSMLFVQLTRTQVQPIQVAQLHSFVEDVVRYFNEETREFLGKLFEGKN